MQRERELQRKASCLSGCLKIGKYPLVFTSALGLFILAFTRIEAFGFGWTYLSFIWIYPSNVKFDPSLN